MYANEFSLSLSLSLSLLGISETDHKWLSVPYLNEIHLCYSFIQTPKGLQICYMRFPSHRPHVLRIKNI